MSDQQCFYTVVVVVVVLRSACETHPHQLIITESAERITHQNRGTASTHMQRAACTAAQKAPAPLSSSAMCFGYHWCDGERWRKPISVNSCSASTSQERGRKAGAFPGNKKSKSDFHEKTMPHFHAQTHAPIPSAPPPPPLPPSYSPQLSFNGEAVFVGGCHSHSHLHHRDIFLILHFVRLYYFYYNYYYF